MVTTYTFRLGQHAIFVGEDDEPIPKQCGAVDDLGSDRRQAADNLKFAKILIQLGLDPDNVTYDAIFNRLLEIFFANITIANLCALVGAVFLVATLLTRTMVPLRVSNMFSKCLLWLLARSLVTLEPFLCFSCCCPSTLFASVQSGFGKIYRLLVNLKGIVNLRLTGPLSTILLVFTKSC